MIDEVFEKKTKIKKLTKYVFCTYKIQPGFGKNHLILHDFVVKNAYNMSIIDTAETQNTTKTSLNDFKKDFSM